MTGADMRDAENVAGALRPRTRLGSGSKRHPTHCSPSPISRGSPRWRTTPALAAL
jgi:hypothetical protein